MTRAQGAPSFSISHLRSAHLMVGGADSISRSAKAARTFSASGFLPACFNATLHFKEVLAGASAALARAPSESSLPPDHISFWLISMSPMVL